jgi:aminoglycoside phosphotransferase (APT) family kinase protein
MDAEVVSLRETVEAHPAFDQLLSTLIHGDLWLDNIVWVSGDAWHIVDWDDLQIGDPAMDVAMLTGPTASDLAPLKRFEIAGRGLGSDLAERVTLLGRASLLDWAIDPLADWIEAVGVLGPERGALVREEKERVHRTALELYRSLYDRA